MKSKMKNNRKSFGNKVKKLDDLQNQYKRDLISVMRGDYSDIDSFEA